MSCEECLAFGKGLKATKEAPEICEQLEDMKHQEICSNLARGTLNKMMRGFRNLPLLSRTCVKMGFCQQVHVEAEAKELGRFPGGNIADPSPEQETKSELW